MVFNSDEVQFAAAKVCDLRQRFFTSVFSNFVAQQHFRRIFFTPDNIAMSFPPVFHRVS
jgi:hypothetical protein